jgi:endonuclease YncB( thermonuclease family)
MRIGLAALLLSFVSAPAFADGLPPGLIVSERAMAARALDSDTVALADGRALRLAGIFTVKAAEDAPRTALAAAARALLDEFAGGRALDLAFDTQRGDRYGRVLAHAVNDQGAWLQAEMLRAGLARVATSAAARAGAVQMLTLEDEARQKQRGMWAQSAWRVRESEAVTARDVDSFQIVHGTVRSVAAVKGRTYLNFGDDWRHDFTVAITPAAAKLCRSAGLDPGALAGKSLRVRGWIRLQNGPLIELTHPEQIEVLP